MSTSDQPPEGIAAPATVPSGPPPADPGPPVTPPPASPTRAAVPPDRRPAGGLVLGIMLVVVGGVVLAGRVLDVTLGPDAWPLWLIVPGAAMVLGSFAIPRRGGVGLAIPGAMLTMVGVVLWVQAAYDLYATWAYAWALVVPTGPGLGMLLYGLARGDAGLVADGLRTTLVGLALFVGFALFFEGVVGLSGHRIEHLDDVLPYAAIGLGLLLVALSFLGGGRRQHA